jgi:hypothetical protein
MCIHKSLSLIKIKTQRQKTVENTNRNSEKVPTLKIFIPNFFLLGDKPAGILPQRASSKI